eukprot:2216232-Pleurochrysis_carterae.AAC.4
MSRGSQPVSPDLGYTYSNIIIYISEEQMLFGVSRYIPTYGNRQLQPRKLAVEELSTYLPRHSSAHSRDRMNFQDCAHDGDTGERGGARLLLTHPPSPDRGDFLGWRSEGGLDGRGRRGQCVSRRGVG